MKVLVIAISVVFTVLVAVLVTVPFTSNKGSFLIINKAKEPIARASVLICGQMFEMKDIQPTKSILSSYKVKSDSHYDVKIEFRSGKKLQKGIGYVTNGIDFHDEIVVTDTDIEITNVSGF